jgi:hypothetical protein
VSAGLPLEPGIAPERASGHQALGCTGADVTESINLDRSGDREASAEGTGTRTFLLWQPAS